MQASHEASPNKGWTLQHKPAVEFWVMTRFLRKATALVAVYAIVVQALLLGLALAAHAGFDPSTIICSSQNSSDQEGGGPPDHRDIDCGACILACGASPAVAATSGTVIFIATSFVSDVLVSWLLPPRSSAKYQPHASRAPPIAA